MNRPALSSGQPEVLALDPAARGTAVPWEGRTGQGACLAGMLRRA